MGHGEGGGGDTDLEEVVGSVKILDCGVDHASVVVIQQEVLDAEPFRLRVGE